MNAHRMQLITFYFRPHNRTEMYMVLTDDNEVTKLNKETLSNKIDCSNCVPRSYSTIVQTEFYAYYLYIQLSLR